MSSKYYFNSPLVQAAGLGAGFLKTYYDKPSYNTTMAIPTFNATDGDGGEVKVNERTIRAKRKRSRMRFSNRKKARKSYKMAIKAMPSTVGATVYRYITAQTEDEVNNGRMIVPNIRFAGTNSNAGETFFPCVLFDLTVLPGWESLPSTVSAGAALGCYNLAYSTNGNRYFWSRRVPYLKFPGGGDNVGGTEVNGNSTAAQKVQMMNSFTYTDNTNIVNPRMYSHTEVGNTTNDAISKRLRMFLEGVSAKFKFYGRMTDSTFWRVDLVKFTDRRMDPALLFNTTDDGSGANTVLSAEDYKIFNNTAQSLLRPYVQGPDIKGPHYVKHIKTLKSWKFKVGEDIVQGNAGVDEVTSVSTNIYVPVGKSFSTYYTDWDAQNDNVYAEDSTRLSDFFDTYPTTTSKVDKGGLPYHVESRLYLMIRASATNQLSFTQTGSYFTNIAQTDTFDIVNNMPTFDMDLKAKWRTFATNTV